MISFFKEKGFICNSVMSSPKLLEENSVCFSDINEFVSFLLTSNIKSILYSTFTESIEDYIISESIIEEEINSIYIINTNKKLMKEIEKYNAELEKIDFSQFKTTVFFVLFNGFILYYINQDGISILNPADKLKILFSENINIIEEQEKYEEKITLTKEKLKQIILNDPKFRNSTNRTLRRVYISDLLKSLPSEFDILKNLWIKKNGKAYRKAWDFIEIIWNEYKSTNK